MRQLVIAALLCIATSIPVYAEPVVKVINFTADWCPNCRILNPRIDEAIQHFGEGEVVRVDLDVTSIRRISSQAEKAELEARLLQVASTHKARYLWDWYGGVTGIAVAISADTGEALACVMRPMTVKDIENRLTLAKILAENGRPGTRTPDGINCPVLK